ncbi:MAG TPA: DUF2071 domain-containing protein [Verrucomicrobiae bacterium]|nr:DUF2071 domain-containing protein [Verrucomicrobiae bacterium]
MSHDQTTILPGQQTAKTAFETSALSAAARRRLLSVKGEPLFYADWLRVLFLHFEVDAEALQREVPFPLDLHEGRAYVSLVAFTMRDMRPRVGGRLGTLLFKPIATHNFLNVRTYVKHRGETGIHFLAEWLDNPLSVLLGPLAFGLPYRFGQLHYQHNHEAGALHGQVIPASPFFNRNRSPYLPRLEYRAEINPNPMFGPCDTNSLDEFLLERYTAFNGNPSRRQPEDSSLTIPDSMSRRFFRIWHPPWPQVPVHISSLETGLLESVWPWFAGARLVGAHYSPGVHGVWMGRPQTCAH